MMTDPASAVKREVFQLVELQIEVLRQEGRLADSALVEYHERSEKSLNSTERATASFGRASTGGPFAPHRSICLRGPGRLSQVGQLQPERRSVAHSSLCFS